jgi:F-type H+-transporting ATPase subunit b
MINLIVEIIVLLFIIWLIKKFVWPLLITGMNARQAEIKAALESADNARRDAAAAEDELTRSLEEAKTQAAEIVAQGNRTAERISAESDAKAQAEYDRIIASAQAEVTLARQRAADEATQELGTVVMEVVEQVIGREADTAAHESLINQAVAALDGAEGAGS